MEHEQNKDQQPKGGFAEGVVVTGCCGESNEESNSGCCDEAVVASAERATGKGASSTQAKSSSGCCGEATPANASEGGCCA